MKKLMSYCLLSALALNLVAQELPFPAELEPTDENTSANIYENIREAKSALITDINKDEIVKLYRGTKSLDILKNIMTDKNINNCATKVVSAIESQLNLRNDYEVKIAILGLRLNDSIDDIAADILIKASALNRPLPQPIARDNLSSEEEAKALKIFAAQTKEIKDKIICVEDTYKNLVSKLASESPKFLKTLKHINKLAVNNNLISNVNYRTFEMMRASKVHEWPLTLSSYKQELASIARRFPNRLKEVSDFITEKNGKNFGHKSSLRQSLYEKYNGTQIILLANMVRELKNRLDAKEIVITINYVDQESEVITLSPMEKFKFILKVLRRELATLNNGSLLNRNTATFSDLITASYEVGYISATEIKQLASLEEIWNHKKTKREKAIAWGQRFGGIASILLPPPFGFVSLMAIMVIDQYTSPAPINGNLDYDIF